MFDFIKKNDTMRVTFTKLRTGFERNKGVERH